MDIAIPNWEILYLAPVSPPDPLPKLLLCGKNLRERENI
jgi:hypothetical protein